MINIMIKPASGKCDLKCEYCFYRDEMSRRRVADRGIMSAQTAKRLIEKAFDFADDGVSFTFQGGEPTLAGLDFFRGFAGLAQSTAKNSGKVAEFGIQTNGMLVDGQWTEFFAKNNFLVGLSVDGTETLHDAYRKTPSGKGSYTTVMETAERLKGAGVQFNVVTVVTAQLSSRAREVYSDYKQRGFAYQQYIPCLDTTGGAYAPTDRQYLLFLKELFDCYKEDMLSGRYVYIRRFENLRGLLAGYQPEECCLKGCCMPELVVEADGSVYPCDFFCTDGYLLGNINEHSVKELLFAPNSLAFSQNNARKDIKCLSCRWARFCRGGCPREHIGENYRYCEATKDFLDYAIDDLYKIARLW